MKFRFLKIDKSKQHVLTKKQVKNILQKYEIELTEVCFKGNQAWEIDSGCKMKPRLNGPVVISASHTKSGSLFLFIYSLKADMITPDLQKSVLSLFEKKIIPWLISRQNSEILRPGGHEQILLEKRDMDLKMHALSWQ